MQVLLHITHIVIVGLSAFHPYYCRILVGTPIATRNPACTEKFFICVCTILFKIIARMKILIFANYLGGYRYSFQVSSELIRITVAVSLFF